MKKRSDIKDDIPAPNMKLEWEANKLLREAGATNHRCSMAENQGIYTEKQLERRRRREYSNYEDGIELFCRVEKEEQSIADAEELFTLCRLAGFSDEQILIWSLFRSGSSCEDIAHDVLNVSPEAVFSRIQRCRKRLIVTMAIYPWLFWYSVYLSEVNRRD